MITPPPTVQEAKIVIRQVLHVKHLRACHHKPKRYRTVLCNGRFLSTKVKVTVTKHKDGTWFVGAIDDPQD